MLSEEIICPYCNHIYFPDEIYDDPSLEAIEDTSTQFTCVECHEVFQVTPFIDVSFDVDKIFTPTERPKESEKLEPIFIDPNQTMLFNKIEEKI